MDVYHATDFIERKMNEDWNDDISSEDGSYYSDRIDSDVEAELYSLIHHDVIDNSILSLENVDSSEENSSSPQISSVQPQCSSDLSKNISISENELINGNKKYIKFIKRNSSLNEESFSSDTAMNFNLFTSFETPERLNAIQSSQNKFEKTTTNKSRQKKKSDYVSKILETIQVTQESNSRSIHLKDNSLKKTINHRHSVKQSDANSIMREEVVSSSSSDSDSSVIFIESDESELQTNLMKRMVTDCYESDSSLFEKSCRVKSNSLPNSDLNSNKKDPWHINYDDAFRSRKFSNRYHGKEMITCTNCCTKGHSAKFCSASKTIKCFICGGDHVAMRCRDRVCPKCNQKGHDNRRCLSRIIHPCHLCNMYGHKVKNCPDLWRRYHLTTSLGRIIKGRRYTSNTPIFCYNCGFEGHYGAECPRPRMDDRDPTWTSVISYNNPRDIFRKERKTCNSKYNSKRANDSNALDKDITFSSKKRKQSMLDQVTLQHKKRKQVNPAIAPKQTNKNTVGKEVYFPRTPKAKASTSKNKANPENNCIDFQRTLSPKQLKIFRKQLSNKKHLKAKQREHREGLQRRLGLQTA